MSERAFQKANYEIRTAIDLTKLSIALDSAERQALLSECERKTFEKMAGTVVTAICNAMAERAGHHQSTPIR